MYLKSARSEKMNPRLTSCFLSLQKLLFLFQHVAEKHVIMSSLSAGVRGLSEVRFKLIRSSYSVAVII